jgi:hypothetical protein
MATVSFSIPDDVKDRFDAVFKDVDRNALVIQLILKAIESKTRPHRPGEFVARLRSIRARSRLVSDDEISRARENLRT